MCNDIAVIISQTIFPLIIFLKSKQTKKFFSFKGLVKIKLKTFSSALGVLVAVKQQSSFTVSLRLLHPPPLLFLSGPADITSCLCPPVLLEWVTVVVRGAEHQQKNGSQSPQSVSNYPFSDQIKYLNIQSLDFLPCPLVCCPLQVGLWMWDWLDKSEQCGGHIERWLLSGSSDVFLSGPE